MASTIEFLKRNLLERKSQSPEKIADLIEQSESGSMTLAELLVDKGIMRDDELGKLLAAYVEEESRSEDKQIYENALFGLKVVEKGLAWNSDVWKALREQEKEQGQGNVKSVDWFLVKEGRIAGEKILEILDETSRFEFFCKSCGRRQILRKDTAGDKVACKDCRTEMEQAKDPSDFKDQGAKEYDPLIGKEVGGCKIDSIIGAGGMGSVYKARLVSLNKVVAVKILTSGEMNESARKRFVREARTAARLEHQNVVQTYNTGTEGDLSYIVMQYIDGPSISKKMKADGLFTIQEALRISIEAAKGIQAAHNLGMIHRDIKPDNLMIDKTGTIKVADFGLAKDTTVESSLTLNQQALGTPTYMSPEQAKDAASVDARSDIYSFGATVYAMLAGQPPFVGSSAWAIVSQHLNDPVPDVRQKNPKVPEALWLIIRKCMAKAPEERPKDMGEVLEALFAVQTEMRGGKTRKFDVQKTEATLDLPHPIEAAPKPKVPSEPSPAAAPAPAEPAAPGKKQGKSLLPVFVGGAVLAVAAAAVLLFAVILPSMSGGGKGGGQDSGEKPDDQSKQGGSPDQPGGRTQGGGPGPASAEELKILDLAPADNSFHKTTEIEVAGTLKGGSDPHVLVYSDPAIVHEGKFHRRVKLGEGSATILISAWNGEDRSNKKDGRINVIVDTTPPKLALRSPAASEHGLIMCRTEVLEVTVTMIESYPDKVLIEGIEARQDGVFFIASVPVGEDGKKVLSAKGFDKAGNVAELLLEVFRDTRLPKIAFEDFPREVRGGKGSAEAAFTADEPLSQVKVNGRDLTINKEGRYSLALDLKEGGNPISVEVTDLVGNKGTAETSIEFQSDIMIAKRKDEDAWKKALENYAASADEFGRMAVMKDYVDRFPEGTHVLEAGQNITASRKERLPEGVSRTFEKGVFVFEKLGVELILVPAGKYGMGRNGDRPEEGPAHEAGLSAFFVTRTEIPNSVYAKYLNLTSAAATFAPGITREAEVWKPLPGLDRQPVTNVSWQEAADFAAWARGSLPSEAQWEAAARGTAAGPYPWGSADPDKTRCNCRETGTGSLADSGSLPAGASELGVLDMAGNAAEWCLDFFHPDAYLKRGTRPENPVGTAASYSRTIRGGAFSSPAAMCTVFARIGLDPKTRMPWIGFRIVLGSK